MDQFTGTWRLVRLALRRDRIKLTIWTLAIIGMTAAIVPSVQETYGAPAERAAYAASIGTSMVARMFNGILDGDSLGAIVMVESYVFMAVLVAFMSTLLVVRHTRQNEETGSTELLQSARVGRYANLTAAMVVALMANAVVGLGVGAILSGFNELSSTGGWLFGAALGVVGMSFAAVAAVTAQLSESGRGANSWAGLAIGAAFILRGIGDGFAANVTWHVTSGWTSWLSPLGWGQQIFPFTRQDTWLFWLFAGFIIVTMTIAYSLLAWRDVGAGILPVRKGLARAKSTLLSPLGLAWRLQKGVFIMWACIVVVLGITFGSMSNQLNDLFSTSDVIKEYVVSLGGQGAIIEAFLGAMIAMMAIVIVAYAVQILQRLRTEESSNHLEILFGLSVGRLSWLGSYVFIALFGAVMLAILLGLSLGVSSVIATSGEWSDVGRFIGAALTYLPAIGVFIGLVVACFGLLPKAVIAFSWSLVVFALLIGQLGALLKLPEWVMDLSPFSHIPAVPSEAITATPLVILSAISVSLVVIGMLAFKRRNIQTS